MKKSEYLDRWAGRIFNLLIVLITGFGIVVMAAIQDYRKVYLAVLMFLFIFIVLIISGILIFNQNINEEIDNDN